MVGGNATGGESLGTAPSGRLRRAAARSDTSGTDLGQGPGVDDRSVGRDLGGGDSRLTAGDLAGVDAYFTATAPPDSAVVRLRAAEVARRRSMLVKPPGYDRALAQLRTHRLVLFLGGAGTGRETAALGLLAELGERTDVLVVRDPSRAELDEYELSEGCRVLLDLPRSSDDSSIDVSNATRVLVERIEASSGYAVISSMPGQRAVIDETYGRYARAIGEVRAMDVLVAHLREHGASDALIAAVERAPVVRDFCADARPAIAARLATQLLAGSERPAGDRDPVVLVEHTVRAFARFGNDATVRFDAADRRPSPTTGASDSPASNPAEDVDPPELARSLLLSAAFTENLDVGALQIEDVLLDQLGRPTGTHPLGRVGTGLRLRRLDDVVREDDGSVTFRHEAHAIELLCHVWVNYPHLRPALYSWMRAIPDAVPESLDTNERFAIAEQFVRLCDRVSSVKHVVDLIAEWAAGSRESRRTAMVALSRAALSWTIGQRVRTELFSWAVDEASPAGLHDVVLHACSGPFARSYPRVALTVLGQLAGHTRTADRARAAIVELARDETVLPYVFEILAEWFGGSERALAVGVLAELLSPSAPVAETALCRDRTGVRLIGLIHRVLDDPDPDASKETIALFLEYARSLEPGRRVGAAAVASVLAESVRGSSQRSGRLVWAVADWLAENRWNGDGAGPERRDLYERITRSVESTSRLVPGGVVGE